MPLERRDLERTLRTLGFEEQERDHRWFTLHVKGSLISRTKTSHGTGHHTIAESLVAEIARQMHISRAFLYELVAGTKTSADYLNALRSQSIID